MARELCGALLYSPSQLESEQQSLFWRTLQLCTIPHLLSSSPPLPSPVPPQFEGTLTVDIPPFILGYSQGRQQDVLEFGLEEESFSHTPNTSLHVFVSVDPPLPQLPSVKHKVHVDTHARTHTQSETDVSISSSFSCSLTPQSQQTCCCKLMCGCRNCLTSFQSDSFRCCTHSTQLLFDGVATVRLLYATSCLRSSEALNSLPSSLLLPLPLPLPSPLPSLLVGHCT